MVQGKESSRFSRRIINLFAGMAYGSPDLPRFLSDGGYVCHAIEPTFAVAVNKLVNPELILCSDSEQHTLIIDAKSGANLKADQLQRYSLITSVHLVQAAYVTEDSGKTYNLLIVGQAIHKDRLKLGAKKAADPNRVVALTTDEGLERTENDFATSRLNKAFAPTLIVNWDVIPNAFLPVDHESEPWEFAEKIMPEIVAAIFCKGHLRLGSTT